MSIQSTIFLSLIAAFDFRGRLRFPRAACEPPRLRLRGLTLATFPAGVFVFHSNQKLKQLERPKRLTFLTTVPFINAETTPVSNNLTASCKKRKMIHKSLFLP
jgi:hypothetical protein